MSQNKTFKILLQLIQTILLSVFGRKEFKTGKFQDKKIQDNEKNNFAIDDSWKIPVEKGQAVSDDGWVYSEERPTSITWHWSATWDRKYCDELLGGSDAKRKPQWNEDEEKWEGGASAHYCVGRTYKEGMSQYVSIQHRSWHAGKNQTLRWDGKPINYNNKWLSGSRVSIGIETVNVGFARPGVIKGEDWVEAYGVDGKTKMWIQPWTKEQIDLMIYLGKKIIKEYPNISYLDHHGHMDICPGYKSDPSLAFPFSKVLSGIYEREIPDVWSPFLLIKPRQKALKLLGYNLGGSGVDGIWGDKSRKALMKFQKDSNLEVNGYWTSFVCWEVYLSLKDKNTDLEEFKF